MEMVCIVCPIGCKLTAGKTHGQLCVAGNSCKRGEVFAINEMTNPTRSLTTTVKTTFGELAVLPVRTDVEIPKDKIFEAMKVINSFTLKKPVNCGDILIENILGTSCNIIASCTLK